jgi:homogentisate 1,2-dioxygenase
MLCFTGLPVQLRWRPLPIPAEPVDFVRGLFTMCGAGRCGLERHDTQRH